MKKKKTEHVLAGGGRRLTAARQEILAAIDRIEGHFDPQELYERLRAAGSTISRASVYRTIPVLLEKGILNEADKTDKHTHYEKKTGTGHHDHLVCLGCGKTIEFYSPTLEMLQEEICQREAFKGERHNLVIVGHCQECLSKNT